MGHANEDAADNVSTTSHSDVSSDDFGYHNPELDEFIMNLFDERDVELDPDNEWEEGEDSEGEEADYDDGCD